MDDAVAVIGAGWAGCAAAVTLAAAGVPVHLIEAAPVIGGRARRVLRHGLALDNGQHLLLGAYRATRALVGQLHASPPWRAAPLAFGPWSVWQADAIALRAYPLPAPLGLLAGLATARGLSLRDRAATLRWFAALKRNGYRCTEHATVAELTATLPPRVNVRLWHPLCLAALNTPAAAASAQVFTHVLRDAFDGRASDTEVLWPRVDLTALVGDAAATFVAAHGGHVTTGARAVIAAAGDHGATISLPAGPLDVRAAIVAVAPHQLAATLAPLAALPTVQTALAAIAQLDYEPITTVYLGYTQPLPAPTLPDLVRLDDRPGQWLMDRADILASARPDAPALAQLVSVVISTRGEHMALDHAALVAAVDAQLRGLRAGMPALAWSQVIAEQRATYACTPAALAVRRAIDVAPAVSLHLAGDYLDLDYPATLEAAVRSGRRAANALLQSRGR